MKTITVAASCVLAYDDFAIDDTYHVVFSSSSWSFGKCKSALPEKLPDTTSAVNVLHKKHLADFYNGKTVPFEKVNFITPQELETARLYGFEVYFLQQQKKERVFPIDLFAQLKSTPKLLERVVREDYGSHQLRDLHNNEFPVAQYISYVGSPLCERKYDLKKVVRVLSLRDDVIVVSKSLNRRKPVLKELHDGKDISAQSVDDGVFEIPSYNAERGRNRSVEFIWQPTVETYRRLMGPYNGKYRKPLDKAFAANEFGFEGCMLSLPSSSKPKMK